MIKAWPSSLFGRNALLIAALMIVSQALSIALFSVLVLLPQSNRVAGIVADSVAAVSSTLRSLPPERRGELLAELDRSPYIDIAPGDRPPPLYDAMPTMLERIFMQQLVDSLRDQTEMLWRVGPNRVVWVQIKIENDFYWVASNAPNTIEPLIAVLLSFSIISALGIFAGLLLSRQIGRPLRDLQIAADGIALGAAGSVLAVRGPSEIQALAASFTRMTHRLEATEKDRALVLAGISHDLRTPLAKLRLAVEMMPMESDLRDSAVTQVERMDRLLRQFLDYARGFDAEPLRAVDVARLAREAAGEAGRGAAVTVDAPETLEASVRPEALRRAIINLIENALAHGVAPVQVAVARRGGEVEIAVRDEGPGVPPDLLVELKTPFRRGANPGNASGSGLGLAIVDRIARGQGGRVDLRNRPGGGFEAIIVLQPA